MGVPIMDQGLNRRDLEERTADLENESEKDKSFESMAADSQDDSRTLCEKSLAALYVIQKGRFSCVTSGLCNILGYEGPEELIGKSFWELIHPDDRGLAKLSMEREQAQGLEDWPIVRVFKKDGTILWVRMAGSTAIYQGDPANVGHLINLTPLKKKEKSLQESLEKYQTILSQMEEGVGEETPQRLYA